MPIKVSLKGWLALPKVTTKQFSTPKLSTACNIASADTGRAVIVADASIFVWILVINFTKLDMALGKEHLLKGRLSTIDLLGRVACFVKSK